MPPLLSLCCCFFLLQQTRLLSQGCPPAKQRSLSLGVLRDIQDGAVYRGLVDSGFLGGDNWNLALGLNTDGVSPYKSSTFSMWPIFWEVHNLPPSMRFRVQYTRICGLWFGKTKPDMNLFFTPCKSELERFHGVSPLCSFFPSFSLPSLCGLVVSCC